MPACLAGANDWIAKAMSRRLIWSFHSTFTAFGRERGMKGQGHWAKARLAIQSPVPARQAGGGPNQ